MSKPLRIWESDPAHFMSYEIHQCNTLSEAKDYCNKYIKDLDYKPWSIWVEDSKGKTVFVAVETPKADWRDK